MEAPTPPIVGAIEAGGTKIVCAVGHGPGAGLLGPLKGADGCRLLDPRIIPEAAATGRNGRKHGAGKDQRPAHSRPTSVATSQPETMTTQTSEVGRKIFQPRRISWS